MDNYRNLGIIHVLSISGLHVGLYALIVSCVCFYFKRTELETMLICTTVLFLGVLLSKYQSGFVRASLTYVLGQSFRLRKIHINNYDLLGLTFLIHIAFVPRLLLGTGAVLSYVLAFSLILTEKLGKFKQTIAINGLLTPLLLFNFYQFNILTILFNFLIVPYFDWVVVPATLINLFLHQVLPQLTSLFEAIFTVGEKIIKVIAQTNPGMIIFGKINWWQTWLLLILTTYLLIFDPLLQSKRSKKMIHKLILVYIILFMSIYFPLTGQVTFIDVGQGDSILITTPFLRKSYLIDTGGKLNFSKRKITPQINKITLPFLKAQGISKLDGVFVSHQDADHVGDLGPLLEEIKVKKLYVGKGILENPAFRKRIARRVSHTKIIEVLAGDVIREGITFNVLHPNKPGKGTNEDSMVLLFDVAKKSWLFSGDLDQKGEENILQEVPSIHANYFKLGHHGSRTSTSKKFLTALKPELTFISAGRNNRFGHPHAETLRTLKQLQIPEMSTQQYGMISYHYGFGRPKFTTFLKGTDFVN